MSQTYQFQAEINQLLSLIINAFYSSKDVFLRELLSNSSDALDKIRHESLTDDKVLQSENKLEIKLIPNKEDNTLTIMDTGIGMNQDDLINKLGTIAKSGTKEFAEKLKEKKSNLDSLIGQFGVGFYSAYLVANNVTVRTKHNDDKELLWESNAEGTFTITQCEETKLTRGTEIILHLKEECSEYLEEHKLRELVKKHSEFINYPIYLLVKKQVDKQTENNTENTTENNENNTENNDENNNENNTENNNNENNDENNDENVTVEKDEKEVEKETVNEFEHLNKTQPIWTRDQSNVTHEEYVNFYKHLTNDYEEFATMKHFKVEGNLSFTGLLFVPSRPPLDFLHQHKKLDNLKLYVRRVFISDNCQDLVPEYLSFVKGVIDSEDLPLNVSREFFQDNSRVMRTMKKQITKKCLDMFTELSQNKEKYLKFYEYYSKNLKLGVHEDHSNRDKLSKLLLFKTYNQEELQSLDHYVENMKEDQTEIYYLAGDNYSTLKKSSLLEKCITKGYNVLLLTETIDEYAIQALQTYKDKKLICLAKNNVKFDSDDEKDEEYKSFMEKVKELLSTKVDKVVVSHKLTTTPCCLTVAEHAWSPNMQKIIKMQAMSNTSSFPFEMGKPTLELNVNHPVIQSLKHKFDNQELDTMTDKLVFLLETAMLDCGFTLDNPREYTEKVFGLLTI